MALTKAQLKRGSVGEYAEAPITMLDGAEDTVKFTPPIASVRKRVAEIQKLDDDEKTGAMLDLLADHILDADGEKAFDNGDEIPLGLMGQLSQIILNVEVTKSDGARVPLSLVEPVASGTS